MPETWSANSSRPKPNGQSADWDFGTRQDFTLAARLGYAFNTNLAAEVELGYRPSDFGLVRDNNTDAPFGLCQGSGSFRDPGPNDPACKVAPGVLEVFSMLGNGVWTFGNDDWAIRPFVGAGLGLGRVNTGVNGRYRGTTEAGINRVVGTTTTIGLAWQAEAGVSWKLNDRASIDFAYKNFNVQDVQLDLLSRAPWLGTFEGDFKDHSVTLGLRWAFGPQR